ncbi:hypothetical protein VN24_25530 [Paenibacillus beijingensis]|uniref:Alpha/beta hydrolase n=2 Tax=Paenibacillus beijingensis TaxID=1126833 RepID=A0A0D5NS85_9BACL|nr:hypothetical protein VN24_25530 [Paenibacillus beijingensis]
MNDIWMRLVGRARLFSRYDTPFWRLSVSGLWAAATFVSAACALGMPTGFGAALDVLLFAALGTAAMGLAAVIFAVLLALLALPVPRLFTGCALYLFVGSWVVLHFAELDLAASAAIAAAYTLAGAAAGLIAGAVSLRLRTGPGLSSRMAKRAVAALVLLLLLAGAAIPLANAVSEPAVTAVSYDRANEAGIANPAAAGPYAYTSFTYGSGSGRRPEFADQADIIAPSVDASSYISKWPFLKKLYWGFDETALPLGGRVWMPAGEGSFPLALIVHGNHLMEQPSDGGYAYLGELLASRGFIAVSVDENFLNFSVWSGIPDNDMKARAWMLLKHLQQIQEWDKTANSPFFGKVNIDQIALIGHSRGGQATAMAADASRWFAGDRSLAGAPYRGIKAVIALAPTDMKVNGKKAELKDVSYLTLQGARDGDVNDFYGDRQYIRSSIGSGKDAIKASLYIADANHSRFNTEWGTMDDSLPDGLLLSQNHMLSGNEQREIAKVYVSAFLERIFHGAYEYNPLFKDYRTGSAWLPETNYFSRYGDGGYTPLATFDEDSDKTTAEFGGRIAASGAAVWSEVETKDRQGQQKGTKAVVLSWTGSGAASRPASLTVTVGADAAQAAAQAKGLTFSIADRTWELPASSSAAGLQTQVELESRSGEAVRLPLSGFMEVKRPPHTEFTRFGWLDKRMNDGKYESASEAVFQTCELPFSAFIRAEPGVDPGELVKITFYFNNVSGGKVMLDDIGFYSS